MISPFKKGYPQRDVIVCKPGFARIAIGFLFLPLALSTDNPQKWLWLLLL